MIEFSVSCDVISSLLPGLTPGLFYVPAALAKRSLGAPLSRAATTIPQRQRSGRRGAGKVGAIAPVQAAAWWGCHQVLVDKPGPLADQVGQELDGGEARAPEPGGGGQGAFERRPTKGATASCLRIDGGGSAVATGRRQGDMRKPLARPRSGGPQARPKAAGAPTSHRRMAL